LESKSLSASNPSSAVLPSLLIVSSPNNSEASFISPSPLISLTNNPSSAPTQEV